MLRSFARAAPRRSSELSHQTVSFLPRNSLHISRHYALSLIARKTATLFSELFTASTSATSTPFRAIHRASSAFANFSKICFRCMSQKCATISNSSAFRRSRQPSHGSSKVLSASLKSTKFSFSGIVFSASSP